MFRYWLIFGLALLAMGALGFRSDTECTPSRIPDPTQRSLCWHEAGVSHASVSGSLPAALNACEQARTTGAATGEAQSNLCYADIAEIFRDGSICSNIRQTTTGLILTGAETSKAVCEEKVRRLQGVSDYRCVLLPVPFALLALAIYSQKGRP